MVDGVGAGVVGAVHKDDGTSVAPGQNIPAGKADAVASGEGDVSSSRGPQCGGAGDIRVGCRRHDARGADREDDPLDEDGSDGDEYEPPSLALPAKPGADRQCGERDPGRDQYHAGVVGAARACDRDVDTRDPDADRDAASPSVPATTTWAVRPPAVAATKARRAQTRAPAAIPVASAGP